VIDNSANEGDVEDWGGASNRWQSYRAASNLGFGPACNVGARITSSEYLLFLNADVRLAKEACKKLVLVAESDAEVAVVGPRIYDADGEIELSARKFPSLSTGIFGRSSLATRLLRRASAPPRNVRIALRETATGVDWVSGACMLVRRNAFNTAGGFDETYWMYWEDADLCRRLADRGWRTMFCPQAVAEHMTGSSGRDARTIEAFHVSASRYYERHVARCALETKLARAVLDTRMKLAIRRHDN
jgi:GT2 family glycosyltransferase